MMQLLLGKRLMEKIRDKENDRFLLRLHKTLGSITILVFIMRMVIEIYVLWRRRSRNWRGSSRKFKRLVVCSKVFYICLDDKFQTWQAFISMQCSVEFALVDSSFSVFFSSETQPIIRNRQLVPSQAGAARVRQRRPGAGRERQGQSETARDRQR